MNADNRQFGICSYSYIQSFTAMEFLQRLGDMGFVEFELMMYPGHLWPADVTPPQISALRSLIEKKQLHHHHLKHAQLRYKPGFHE